MPESLQGAATRIVPPGYPISNICNTAADFFAICPSNDSNRPKGTKIDCLASERAGVEVFVLQTFTLRGNRRGGRRVALALSLCAALALLPRGTLWAQRAIAINGNFFFEGQVGSDQKAAPSFQLPVQSSDVKDAVEEFTRLVKHEQWEKAFKSLDAVSGKSGSGFIDRGDGVLVPSRLLVRGLLASLPSAGKNAYRLFYDAQATALWDKAHGKPEAELLQQIVNNHIISSVGDRAADRLGDLYFEQGEFEQAVGAWRTILSFCPDSKLPKPQILVKIATALARSQRWAEFTLVEDELRERYAAEMVELGGQRLAAKDQMARLASATKATPDSSSRPPGAALADDLNLPGEAEPLWQFRLQSKVDPQNPTQPFPLTDVYGRQRANDFMIPAAADDQRVYANIFGVEMAFDIATGKLLWRSGKLHLLQLQQQRQGVMPERYSITVSQGRTWSVLRDPQQANQGIGFALVVRDAASGKEVFSTRRSLSAWNVLGTPYLSGEAIAAPGESVPAAPQATAEAAPTIDFSKGFAAAADRLSINGTSGKIDGAMLRLTDGNNSQKASVYYKQQVSVAAFSTQFELRLKNAVADGMTFVIQGIGPTAIGKMGGGLAYQEMEKSVAVKFDLHSNSGEGTNSTGLYLNGAVPEVNNSVDLSGTPINLHSGHPIRVNMDYDGQVLQVTMTDTATQASDMQSYPVNIPAAVGASTAYVGFTGSSGGLSAVQHVANWTYTTTSARKAGTTPINTVYVGASRTNPGRELALLVLNGRDGKLLRTVTLGNYTVDQNQVYGDRIAVPSFLAHHDRLYVDTHAGALVSLQPQSGSIDWGILYDSPPPMTGYNYNYDPPPLGVSGPIRAAGLMFAKGMRSSRLLGVQTEGPGLAWKRPVSKTAVILAADDERIYMGGEELTAYSIKTQELLWATQLPRSASWSTPVLTRTRLYQFTSRGICEVDKQTGEVLRIFRGADLDSLGGALLVTPQALITVSNLAITAYPRHDAPAADKSAAN